MGRAKYKIGNLIKTRDTEEVPSASGVVTGIVNRTDGYSYEVQGLDEEVLESDVAASFVERRPRQPKAKTGKPSKRSRKKSQDDDAEDEAA